MEVQGTQPFWRAVCYIPNEPLNACSSTCIRAEPQRTSCRCTFANITKETPKAPSDSSRLSVVIKQSRTLASFKSGTYKVGKSVLPCVNKDHDKIMSMLSLMLFFKCLAGGVKDSWELFHVTLSTSKKFRVVFEGIKGTGGATGGLSLDDINLSETECPHHTWRIRNFTHLLATTPTGVKHYSPRFTSRDGYTFQVGVYINGRSSPGNMAIYLHLTSGPDDDKIQWPCPWRQGTMALMDQNPDIRLRMNNYRMVTTDPDKTATNCEFLFIYFTHDYVNGTHIFF